MSGRSTWLSNYRVELVLFTYYLVSHVASIATTNLIIQKVCYPDGSPGVSVPCDKPDILKDTSYMFSTLSYLKDFLPGVLVLVAGSWRDNTGRSRPLVMLGLTGEILATAFTLVSTLVWGMSAWTIVLVNGILLGFTGNVHIMTVACIASLTDETTQSQRTTRMSSLMAAIMGGVCIAIASSGFILGVLGFSGFYILMLLLYIFTFFLSIFSITDRPREQRSDSGILSSVKGLKAIFRPRPNGFSLWLIMIANFIVNSILKCEGNLSTQFYMKAVKITPQQQGLVSFTKLFLSLIAGAALTPLLTNYFKVSEFLLSIIATMTSAISCFGLARSTTLLELFIYSSLDFMRIMLFSILGSLVSKTVKKSENGVYSGFRTFGNSLLPAALNPLYLYTFNNTFEIFPGAFFLLSGGLLTVCGILMGLSWCYYDSKLVIKEEHEVMKGSQEVDDKKEN